MSGGPRDCAALVLDNSIELLIGVFCALEAGRKPGSATRGG